MNTETKKETKSIGFGGAVAITLLALYILGSFNIGTDRGFNYELEAEKNEIRQLITECQSRGFPYSSCVKGYDPNNLTR